MQVELIPDRSWYPFAHFEHCDVLDDWHVTNDAQLGTAVHAVHESAAIELATRKKPSAQLEQSLRA